MGKNVTHDWGGLISPARERALVRRIRTEREVAVPAEAEWDAPTSIPSYRERSPRVVVAGGGRFEDENGGRREAGT